jgi:hypothetical protein
VTVEHGREQLSAEFEALLLSQSVEPGPPPGVLARFDDERARVLIERIGVRLEDAVLGLGERERERVERDVGAEPGEARRVDVQAGRERLLVGAPHERVDAVGADEQVGFRQLAEVADLVLEHQLDAELAGPPLEDAEQLGAADGGETVAVGADHLAAEVHVDRGPGRPCVGDRGEGRLVRVAQAAECLLGEHDAEAERGVGRVALEHHHLVARVRLLEQDREVQTGRAGAEDGRPHARTSASRSSCPGSATVGRSMSSSQPASS